MKRYNIPRYKSFTDEATQSPSILEKVLITAILKIVSIKGTWQWGGFSGDFAISRLFDLPSFILNIQKPSQRVSNSPSRGVVFGLQISPRIQSQNRNSLKGSVRDLFALQTKIYLSLCMWKNFNITRIGPTFREKKILIINK
jgi:hypothetical protein